MYKPSGPVSPDCPFMKFPAADDSEPETLTAFRRYRHREKHKRTGKFFPIFFHMGKFGPQMEFFLTGICLSRGKTAPGAVFLGAISLCREVRFRFLRQEQDAYGLWRGGSSGRCGRLWWPFLHGIRICGLSRVWTADKFFSFFSYLSPPSRRLVIILRRNQFMQNERP